MPGFPRRAVLLDAFKYSFPVFLGYMTLGIAFGFMVSGAGYPWWLAFLMSFWMYAGAGQFIALGLFATGTNLLEACLIQLVVNVRHTAYGLSMLKSFQGMGLFKPYLVFSLTDETFALFSTLPEIPGTPAEDPEGRGSPPGERRRLFMIYVAVLDHCYWATASIIGALAGTLIPFDMEGISFALTALFVVLMIEQIKRVKKSCVFVVSAASALLGVFLLPGRVSLLAALALALFLSAFTGRTGRGNA